MYGCFLDTDARVTCELVLPRASQLLVADEMVDEGLVQLKMDSAMEFWTVSLDALRMGRSRSEGLSVVAEKNPLSHGPLPTESG